MTNKSPQAFIYILLPLVILSPMNDYKVTNR